MTAINRKDYLSLSQLAERWDGFVVKGTIDNWRSQGKGPEFVKFGGKILYPIAAVTAYETIALRKLRPRNRKSSIALALVS